MREVLPELERSDDARLAAIGAGVSAGIRALEEATGRVLGFFAEASADEALGGSADYLMLTGYVCGGWQMARAALVAVQKLAAGEDPDFYQTKLATARFYAEKILPKASALLESIKTGTSGAFDIAVEQL
jgi:3-(methylthio)propanoyl-CoA dehydrogenase